MPTLRQLRISSFISPQLGEPRQREWVRAIVALALLSILGLEIWAAIGAMRDPQIIAKPDAVNAVKDILGLILGPTAALVGAVTGFYYAKSSN